MSLLLLLASPAQAVLPLPLYPECGEVDRPDLCPPDLREYWPLMSYIPAGSRATVRPAELALGSGQWEDRAWRVTTGRFDVLLAVCDSGIDWSSTAYQNKVALNTAELPLPESADGTPAASHDRNGDGLVNIQDYAEDPRVDIAAGDDVADFQLDASDLIWTFSDGVDDDGNGYADDVAGWDFFADDNDPFSAHYDDFGTHGDGVIEEMAAEGGDGDGDIGACPNCSVMMLRTGDSFVTDGNRVALAITYAVDRGAAAVNMSLGALTRPDVLTDAIAYARDHNTSLISVAGDENAYHHNQPALLEGMFYTHSIKTNTDDENNGAYTYMQFLNCNNYGPRMDLVADTPACATGAAAITTGIVGLVQSAAKDRGLTLNNDEVYQLLIQTAQDVYLSEAELAIAKTYPSSPGWDPFFGYGRVNAYAAVERVAAGTIPPTVTVDSPRWFDSVDPGAGTIAITGTLAASRSSGYSFVVEYGLGNNPQTWTALEDGSGTAPFEGTLATLDLSTLPVVDVPAAPDDEGVLDRLERVFTPMVTVRVTVTDAGGLTGQIRKSFFVHRDEGLLPGFPLHMDSSGESSPNLADLDGDGIFEIVIADAGGLVHAYAGDGSELSGWPVQTPVNNRVHEGQPAYSSGDVPALRDGFIATVAVGDLDGDGEVEVVAASGTGGVYAWHADGSTVDGFPVWIEGRDYAEFSETDTWDNGIAGAPTLYDLDGDGRMEIVSGAMDQRLYVWDWTGAPWGPYPIDVCFEGVCDPGARMITSPTIGDVDGDGDIEIGLGTNEAVHGGNDSVSYLYDAVTATLEPGWPLSESGLVNQAALLPIVGEGHPGSLAFADLDGDGQMEVASPVMLGQSPLYHADATVAFPLSYVSTGFGEDNNTSEPSFVTMSNNPAFGDMTGDGVPDFVIGGTGTYYLIGLALFSLTDYQHVLSAWDGATGEMLPGYPRSLEDLQFLVAPAIADVSGDGVPEAIIGSGGYLIYAWDAAGNLAPGWPKFTGNWILGSAALGDIDGDGYLDVVASTREGNVFAWRTEGRADQAVQWASIHHDPQNTGNYATALAPQAGPPDVEGDDPGGCCQKKDENGEEALLVLAPLALLLRRRRRL